MPEKNEKEKKRKKREKMVEACNYALEPRLELGTRVRSELAVRGSCPWIVPTDEGNERKQTYRSRTRSFASRSLEPFQIRSNQIESNHLEQRHETQGH